MDARARWRSTDDRAAALHRAGTAARPRFLNLAAIRFPVGAIVSIGHRLSGLALAALLPFVPAALAASLRSEQAYEALWSAWNSPWAMPAEFIAVWAFLHHVLAGMRHLLMDIGIGARLPQARASAFGVVVAAFLLALGLVALRRLG